MLESGNMGMLQGRCEEISKMNYVREYEGLVTAEILKKDPKWNIWRDGYRFILFYSYPLLRLATSCPGGESPEDITQRVDNVIAKVCLP